MEHIMGKFKNTDESQWKKPNSSENTPGYTPLRTPNRNSKDTPMSFQ
jgi:hypothetical protein